MPYPARSPGEAQWAVDQYAPVHLHSTTPAPPTSARKRGTTHEVVDDADGSGMADATQDGSELTRKKSGGTASDAASAAAGNVALPKHAGSSSAIVSVYHDGESLKLLDIVEFFGVLSVASIDASLTGSNGGDGFDMAPPPASAVPRFHAITYRRLKTPHPLTSGCLCASLPHVPIAAVPALAAEARGVFVASLCAALACDADTATQVLLCIMSNIQDRVSGEAIGSYTLNLRLPAASPAGSARGRCVIFPRVFVLPPRNCPLLSLH